MAKGQPEAYAIQNESPLFAGEAWDKARIAEYQKALLNERLETARLRDELRKLRQVSSEQFPPRTKSSSPVDVVKFLRGRLSRRAAETMRILRARARS